MKKGIYVLVNFICLLLVVLGWCYVEINYLESKVDYFDRLAEGYRKIVYKNYVCESFPWHTIYGKDEKRPIHLFPDFAMNEVGLIHDVKVPSRKK